MWFSREGVGLTAVFEEFKHNCVSAGHVGIVGIAQRKAMEYVGAMQRARYPESAVQVVPSGRGGLVTTQCDAR